MAACISIIRISHLAGQVNPQNPKKRNFFYLNINYTSICIGIMRNEPQRDEGHEGRKEEGC
jgi:hypothetical protein